MESKQTNSFLKKIRILDGTMLKLIAMISMVFDHVGDVFFPDAVWMRYVGRIAMPLFAFCIAEGYIHTHNRIKYLIRLCIFALVSEIPFDLAFERRIGLDHQNIMLSFFLAVLALMLYDRICGTEGKSSVPRVLLGCMAVGGMSAVSLLLRADYTVFAVLGIWLFYITRRKSQPVRTVFGVGFLSILRTKGYNLATALSAVPLLLYNGRKGRGMKWLFYGFYPGHLLLLWLIRCVIGSN